MLDAQQDIAQVANPTSSRSSTIIEITRMLETCDSNDTAVQYDTAQQVLWAYGSGPLGYHGPANRGMQMLKLNPANATAYLVSLTTPMTAQAAATLKYKEFRMPGLPVPQAVTTYACVNLMLPQDTKYQVLQYKGLVGPLVHHMVLYACTSQPSTLNTPYMCPGMPPECKAFWLTWTPGTPGAGYSFPAQAGLPFGANSTTYITLQVHYNNLAQAGGMVRVWGGRAVDG